MPSKEPLHPPKAYNNLKFLNSPDARVIRMLAEFLEPQRRFRDHKVRDSIVFFGSARIQPRAEASVIARAANERMKDVVRPSTKQLREFRSAQMRLEMSKYYEDAVELARLLTEWSKDLSEQNRFVVCSGGGPGIMEAANKGAHLGGGKTIGLNISLPFEQHANPYVTPGLDFEFHYFFMRKLWFVSLAKALVAFPGGFGTLDEMMEVLTLLQTKKVTKRLAVVIYGSEYWRKVFDFDTMIDYGLIAKKDLELFKFMDTPIDAFNYLKEFLSAAHGPAKPDKTD
ncbi:MAG TPA: TIGR00730 family Rossman fold protein [Bacteroidota bacterium]|nr:TIGR00730 family Rossman fold protein [Bacteroidota bacterium]